jgi:hypothetical protein
MANCDEKKPPEGGYLFSIRWITYRDMRHQNHNDEVAVQLQSCL